MEQKDYLLREIEKIGQILRAILRRLTGSPDNLAIAIDRQVEDTTEMLKDMNFDLNHFLALSPTETQEYINSYQGFNIENLELLAKAIMQLGLAQNGDKKKVYLRKALQLLKHCNRTDRTYSYNREFNINAINDEL